MSSVHARFRLDDVNHAQAYYRAPGGTGEAQLVESARVTLNAVQGEPFGACTPSGHMEMLIVNPAASKLFFDAPIGQEFDIVLSAVETPTEVADSADNA